MSKELTGYPSIDKPWLKYYPASAVEAEIPKKTAYQFIFEKHSNNRQAIALEYLGIKISYGKVFDMIDIIARSFISMGVKKGDIVTFALPTMPEMVYIFYALNRIGAVSNAIDPRLQEPEILKILKETNSKILVALDMCLPEIAHLLETANLSYIVTLTPVESLPMPVRIINSCKNRRTKNKEPRFLNWKEFLKIGKNVKEAIEVDYKPNMPVTIVHTGGTTGVPKGVVLSNENLNLMALVHAISGFNFIPYADSYLTFLPPFIAYCLVNAVHNPLYLGCRNILIPSFMPTDFPVLVMKYHPNHILGGPILWDYFIKSSLTQHADLSFIKHAVSGGDSMTIELENDVNNFLSSHGCKYKVSQGYGMTEVSSAACFSTDVSYELGSVGIPFPKNVISIFDTNTGEELTYNQSGEVCIQTPTMMLEYYNNPAATAEVIRKHLDGSVWVHTGDIGRMNENGKLFIEGRIKRMIVRNGNKIFPVAVENVIMTHHAVANCVVTQMPNAVERHVPVAHIVFNKSVEEDKAINEIDQLIRNVLPEFNVPYLYVTRDSLPITGINKIDYKKLEEESKSYQNNSSHIVMYRAG